MISDYILIFVVLGLIVWGCVYLIELEARKGKRK
tara:strand:- start:614 stop:715 length:102 start_codon:yes stop_codon:yes gene_type:complete